jgi:hypothetical protein
MSRVARAEEGRCLWGESGVLLHFAKYSGLAGLLVFLSPNIPSTAVYAPG